MSRFPVPNQPVPIPPPLARLGQLLPKVAAQILQDPAARDAARLGKLQQYLYNNYHTSQNHARPTRTEAEEHIGSMIAMCKAVSGGGASGRKGLAMWQDDSASKMDFQLSGGPTDPKLQGGFFVCMSADADDAAKARVYINAKIKDCKAIAELILAKCPKAYFKVGAPSNTDIPDSIVVYCKDVPEAWKTAATLAEAIAKAGIRLNQGEPAMACRISEGISVACDDPKVSFGNRWTNAVASALEKRMADNSIGQKLDQDACEALYAAFRAAGLNPACPWNDA